MQTNVARIVSLSLNLLFSTWFMYVAPVGSNARREESQTPQISSREEGRTDRSGQSYYARCSDSCEYLKTFLHPLSP